MTALLPDQSQLVQECFPCTPTSISHQSTPILSLDGFLIGHLMAKLNGKITIVNNNGNQFILPDCRIVSFDKNLMDGFVVDIEYQEISKYRTNDNQSGNNGITS
jgi:hypothetical protein